MSVNGKSFEAEVKRGLIKAFSSSLIYRHPDFPRSWVETSKIKYMPAQPVDFLVLDRRKNLAIEVKFTQKSVFVFDRITTTQRKFLQEFQQKAGTSYIIIGIVRDGVEVALISFNDFISLIETIPKKSINFKYDIHDYGYFFKRLHRRLLKKNYYIDLTPLSFKKKITDY
jgi:penicillin-binding protein-related factor A (putative recombinase)